MITYDFKCTECGERHEIDIETVDISGYTGEPKGRKKWNKTGKLFTVDQDKLTERLREKRYCECGGELKRSWTKLQEPMFIHYQKQRIR